MPACGSESHWLTIERGHGIACCEEDFEDNVVSLSSNRTVWFRDSDPISGHGPHCAVGRP